MNTLINSRNSIVFLTKTAKKPQRAEEKTFFQNCTTVESILRIIFHIPRSITVKRVFTSRPKHVIGYPSAYVQVKGLISYMNNFIPTR